MASQRPKTKKTRSALRRLAFAQTRASRSAQKDIIPELCAPPQSPTGSIHFSARLPSQRSGGKKFHLIYLVGSLYHRNKRCFGANVLKTNILYLYFPLFFSRPSGIYSHPTAHAIFFLHTIEFLHAFFIAPERGCILDPLQEECLFFKGSRPHEERSTTTSAGRSFSARRVLKRLCLSVPKEEMNSWIALFKRKMQICPRLRQSSLKCASSKNGLLEKLFLPAFLHRVHKVVFF